MSQHNPLESIDLSALPDVLRKKVQEQLARMSPEMQQEFLKKSRPMLNRAMDSAKTAEKKSAEVVRQFQRTKPHGHYNATIQPGDRDSFFWLKWIAVMVMGYVLYQMLS